MLGRDLIGPIHELGEISAGGSRPERRNPFSAEELVHALQDQGVVVGRRGASARPGGGPGNSPGDRPGGHQRAHRPPVGSARNRGHRGHRRPDFSSRSCKLAAEQEVRTLDKRCAGLLDEAAAPETAPTEPRRRRHPLIQEVAYTTQLKSPPATLHAAVARRTGAPRRADTAKTALIAHYYEAAGEPGREALFAAHAARWLGRRALRKRRGTGRRSGTPRGSRRARPRPPAADRGQRADRLGRLARGLDARAGQALRATGAALGTGDGFASPRSSRWSKAGSPR